MAQQQFSSRNPQDIQQKELELQRRLYRLVWRRPGEKPGTRGYTKTRANGTETSFSGAEQITLTWYE
ncbi:MAG: hypothetical protein JWO52_5903 [Gammaproteobacteria bacterium]|jgi:hypothetical protein|nr:hypothetical protein [Gammaproteobacteria bacterium]